MSLLGGNENDLEDFCVYCSYNQKQSLFKKGVNIQKPLVERIMFLVSGIPLGLIGLYLLYSKKLYS